jgi:hypothetical protein
MGRESWVLLGAMIVPLWCSPCAAEDAPRPSSSGLVAVGRLPAHLKDKFGETFGSGSGMALVPGRWHKTETGYEGELLLLPDRGYNIEGTTDYRSRLNHLSISFQPTDGEQNGTKGRLDAKLLDSLLITDSSGNPTSGLDPARVRAATADLPALPETDGGRISLDPEAIVALPDGSVLISDEYGPAIYHVSGEGRLVSATLPPAAFMPMRKGVLNFSSNNPGPTGKAPDPKDPETGRQNNQGFEGRALSPDRKELTVVLQSATRQDGGDSGATRHETRALVYDATDVDHLKLVKEVVVSLPTFVENGKTKVAAQSEIVWIGKGRYLILCRDSGNGYGQKGSTSLYRQVGLLDVNDATNIADTEFDRLIPVAPKGVVAAGVKPANILPIIDINEAGQLSRFGLHNGPPNDGTNLSEKWEAMTLAPALDKNRPDDFFLFVANDNDFITQDGFQVGAAYKDASGADVDTVILVYRVTVHGLTSQQ